MTCLDTEAQESSPTEEKEERSLFDLEYKGLSTKTDEEVIHQLKENMYLIVSQRFIERLQKSSREDIKSVKKLTIYGMSFGVGRVVTILKLTVDFSMQDLVYRQKFKSAPSAATEATIDCCIDFVVDRLDKRSPSPQ